MIFAHNRCGFRAYLSKHRAKARISSLFHIIHQAKARKTASQPTNTSLDKVLAYLGRHSSFYAVELPRDILNNRLSLLWLSQSRILLSYGQLL